MPRVHHRKARKDYPEAGIKKGDMYYYTAIKLQRGSLVKRSLKPFKPSQLTLSPYFSGTLAAGESWEESDKNSEAMRDAATTLQEIGSACQESFDNMPEGFQQGDTGQMLENRASELESKSGELEGLADELDALEDPGEFDDTDAPNEDDKYDERFADWQALVDEYETEQVRIAEEADELMGEMPE